MGAQGFRLGSVVIGVCLALTLALPARGSGDAAQSDEPELAAAQDPDLIQPVTGDAEALAIDEALLSAHGDIPRLDMIAMSEKSEEFGAVRADVEANRPDLFAGGSVLGEPTLYIKGEADAWIRNRLDDAPINIKLVEGMRYTWDELEQRSLSLHAALRDIGYSDIVTSFDETTGDLQASVRRVGGLPSTVADLRDALPVSLAPDADLELVDSPIAQDFHANGGDPMFDGSGTFRCTSGFSVTHLNTGTHGITTAGHCIGLASIFDSVNSGSVFAVRHKAEHLGAYGDVEWKTTNHAEPPVHVASPNDVRFVTRIRSWTYVSPGDPACAFGRASQYRICDIVYKKSVSKTVGGHQVDRLVMMRDRKVLKHGDSGGPWSWGTTAIGIVQGIAFSDNYFRHVFTPAGLFDEALGIRVRRR